MRAQRTGRPNAATTDRGRLTFVETNGGPVRVLVIGGGHVGLYAAMHLRRLTRKSRVRIALVNPESYMTYQPFLAEAASGSIEPRHVVIPLRPTLKGVTLVNGSAESIDHERRTATIRLRTGETRHVPYDHVVVAPGSISRVLDVPGLAERGIGFKSVGEAIALRNLVIARLEEAEETADPSLRRRLATFLFVGAGYAGVEALAELEDMARYALRWYPNVRRDGMRWVLVDAAPHILPELGPDLAKYALDRLRQRAIDVYVNTRLESAVGGVMRLSNGITFEAETLVWTTGVKPDPLVAHAGFALDERGRILADEYLRVRGADAAWVAGDCAAIPDVAAGSGTLPPTAQHAVREAKRLAANLAASLQGRTMKPFRYRSLGSLATLGLYKGVALVGPVKLRGFPAWFIHRTYHLTRIPTLNRKVRVVSDWTLALLFRRDIVQLGALQDPRRAFIDAAGRTSART